MRENAGKILKRTITTLSPWVSLIEQEVLFEAEGKPERYHSVATADYVQMIARRPDGRIPLVRQYRPAVERATVELPAGLVDPNEHPRVTAQRELLEETGLPTRQIYDLGCFATDTGRLSNRTHSFFIETADQIQGFGKEPRIEVLFVTTEELVQLVLNQAFDVQIQLGTLFQAIVMGHMVL
jgi:ADP-ribose pyrophosphatase